MTDETKPKPKAKDNPWYRLATLHGEPATPDDEFVVKNRVTWNRWMASKISEDLKATLLETGRCSVEELTPFSEVEQSDIQLKIGSDLAGEMDFSDTSFGFSLFGGFIFPRVTFHGATFSSADFTGATFSFAAHFTGATFSYAGFRGATFSSAGFFHGATFSSADFTGATFSFAGFRGATFTDIARFVSATFNNTADFTGATFTDTAHFMSATFNNTADFTGATFSYAVHFIDATFNNTADFVSATFSYTDFERTTFSYARFTGATFSSARFIGATFTSVADFTSTKFTGVANFTSATFASNVQFANAEMGSLTFFARSEFICPPQFFGAKLHEGTVWRDVVWPKPPAGVEQAGEFVEAYERLKLEMDRLKKHGDELDFFARELECRRVLLGFWKGLPLALYGALCGYGRYYMRPLGILVIIVILGAVPIRAHFSDILAFKTFADHGFGGAAIGLSFANTFGILGVRKDLIDPAILQALPGWLKVVATIQTICGIVLLFLFGLSIRNRFRMK